MAAIGCGEVRYGLTAASKSGKFERVGMIVTALVWWLSSSMRKGQQPPWIVRTNYQGVHK
jgi:hypothetical protein